MPGRPERVTFSRKDAQRVANVVRDAERGQRDMPAVKFRQPAGGGGTDARVGVITSSWSKGTTKEITQLNSDGSTMVTPTTFTGRNLFATITVTSGTAKVCCLNVGGQWLLIAAECL